MKNEYEGELFGESLEAPDDGVRLFSLRGLVKAIKQYRQDRKDGWRLDLLSLRPLHDRGGPVSVYSGPSGPIATLARIELNIRQGRPAGEGLPPDALNDPNSP